MREELVAFILLLFVLGGVALMMAALYSRQKFREMAHRERLALIERGLIPSPESDPARFDAATGQSDATSASQRSGARYRTIGIDLIGLGVGLAILIGLTGGGPEIGIGVGGAVAALGVASVINAHLLSRKP